MPALDGLRAAAVVAVLLYHDDGEAALVREPHDFRGQPACDDVGSLRRTVLVAVVIAGVTSDPPGLLGRVLSTRPPW
jgi:peptidoglycan/LPS O-acetylase OafA/YrhL